MVGVARWGGVGWGVGTSSYPTARLVCGELYGLEDMTVKQASIEMVEVSSLSLMPAVLNEHSAAWCSWVWGSRSCREVWIDQSSKLIHYYPGSIVPRSCPLTGRGSGLKNHDVKCEIYGLSVLVCDYAVIRNSSERQRWIV